MRYLDAKIVKLHGSDYLVLLRRTGYSDMSYRGAVIELEPLDNGETYKFRSGGQRYVLTADGERVIKIVPLKDWRASNNAK